MSEPIVKICKKHGELTIDKVKKDKLYKGKQYYRCIVCKSKNDKKYNCSEKKKLNNKKYWSSEKGKAAKKNYIISERGREIRKKISDKYRFSEKGLMTSRQRQKRYRDELHDFYIKNNIIRDTDLKFSEIPRELVELKRLQIQMQRQAKEMRNANN